MKKASKKLISLFMVLCLVLGMIPLTAAAEASGCNHEHGADCTYTEAVEGSPCAYVHEHGEDCGYDEESGAPCTFVHEHDADCGYAEPAAALPCDHVCDADCGGLTLGDSGKTVKTISDFEPLPEGTATLEAATGTAIGDLLLPDELKATADGAEADVPVKAWQAKQGAPAYDKDTAGDYLLVPVFDTGYTVADGVALPEILVTLLLGAASGPLVMTARAADIEIQAGLPGTFTLGTNSSNPTVIAFGGHEWVAIGYDGSGVASEAGTITLLLKNGDAGGGFGTTIYGTVSVYENSALHQKMKDIYNGTVSPISDGEREMILAVTLDGIMDSTYNRTATLADQYVWPLSVSEANDLNSEVRKYSAYWWLRSPSNTDIIAACVQSGGNVSPFGVGVDGVCGVRPAFKLKLSSVIFTSDASGTSGKSDATVGSGLVGASAPTGAVKLTVLDSSMASPTLTLAGTTNSTDELRFGYTGATTGTDQFVSCVLKDGTGVKYYGKLASCATAANASGTLAIDLSGVAIGTYTLEVFCEQANGDHDTDYAGTPITMTVTVANGIGTVSGFTGTVDSTPPTVSVAPSGAGIATTTVNLVLTFDEAIDVSTAGTVTMTPDNITGGSAAYDSTAGNWSAGNTVLTIPVSGLAFNTPYTIDISGFQDVAGNTMTAITGHTFTTLLASPSLTLSATPANSLTLPGNVTLTATLSGAAGGNSGKTIKFSAGIATYTATTDSTGEVTYTVTGLIPGTYSFGASFAGDASNDAATATSITGYTVSLGAQEALNIIGLGNSYTYGDSPFNLSTSGGSGNGAVTYASSDSGIASVSGNIVTIHKAGSFTITATKAADSSYAEASVTSGAVAISKAAPTVTLTGANVSFGENVTLNVTVSGAGATPTGTVTFKEDGADISGAITLSGGAASFTTTTPPSGGDHNYSVEYSGQTEYYNSGIDSITIGVDKIDQTGFAITDPSAITYGDSGVMLTATGGQSTGDVTFSVQTGNVVSVTSGGALTIIGAGTVTVTATKAGDIDYNETMDELEIEVLPRDIDNVSVTVTGNTVYTGSRLQPTFSISDGGLSIDTGDYFNEYGENISAGADAGSITLYGQRNYTGTKTVSFDIEQRPLDGAVITLAAGPYLYTGTALEPDVTSVEVDGITVPASEYDVSYSNNTGVGTATVTVTAKTDGNFSGSASADFTIEVNFTTLGARITAAKAISRGSYTSSTWDALQTAITNAEAVLQTPDATQADVDAAVSSLNTAIAGLRTSSSSGGSSSTYPTKKATEDITDTKTPLADGPVHPAYISGFPDGTFKPDSSLTRAEAAMLFYNLLGNTTTAVSGFSDVSSDAWYYEAVAALSGAGVISGYEDGSFKPDETITRAEFITMAIRFAGLSAQSGATGFPDMPETHWAAGYVTAAINAGYISGYPDGSFGPNNQVTRAEAVTILNRVRDCEGLSEGLSFSDVPKSHWAYEVITAAATGHEHE